MYAWHRRSSRSWATDSSRSSCRLASETPTLATCSAKSPGETNRSAHAFPISGDQRLNTICGSRDTAWFWIFCNAGSTFVTCNERYSNRFVIHSQGFMTRLLVFDGTQSEGQHREALLHLHIKCTRKTSSSIKWRGDAWLHCDPNASDLISNIQARPSLWDELSGFLCL